MPQSDGTWSWELPDRKRLVELALNVHPSGEIDSRCEEILHRQMRSVVNYSHRCTCCVCSYYCTTQSTSLCEKTNIAMAIKNQRMQTKINGKLKDVRQFWRWLLANKVENCITCDQSFWVFYEFWMGPFENDTLNIFYFFELRFFFLWNNFFFGISNIFFKSFLHSELKLNLK